MRGEQIDAQDAFFAAGPSIAGVAGKQLVVTSLQGSVSVAGTLTLLAIPLGSFPVGRFNIRFPGGVVIADPGVAAAVGGTATFACALGGYIVPA